MENQDQRQPESVTMPMELVSRIVQLINNLPYGQVAPMANDIGRCIQLARQEMEAAPTNKLQ